MNFIPPSFGFKGNREKAISLKGQALSFYNHVSRQAEKEGLSFINKVKTLGDGSTIVITSKKEDNYNNRSGSIIITSPSVSVEDLPKGSSIYVTAAPLINQKPKTAIFSYKSVNQITLNPINTTSIFKNRFNQPYIPLIGGIHNAPEYENITKGLPPVSRICNKVIYDTKGNPIVYSGIRETGIKQKSKYGVAQISYQNLRYTGIDNNENVVFDVFLNGTTLFALVGSTDWYYLGGNLKLYAINTTKGALGVDNPFTSVGYKIFDITVEQKGFNLNYMADGGSQSSNYIYTNPIYGSRMLDGKFSPEFATTGEITILGKTRKYWYNDACKITELKLNLIKDFDRGEPLAGYHFPDNIIQKTYDHDASYIYEETTCPEFTKTTNPITANANVYFGPGADFNPGTAMYNVVWFSGPYPTDAAPNFFANFTVAWDMVDKPRKAYYYDDDVTTAVQLKFSYATGPAVFSPGGDPQYPTTIAYIPVGGSADVSCYSSLGAPTEPYRRVEINNVVATVTGNTYELTFDLYTTISGNRFGWHCSRVHYGYKPTITFAKLVYQTIYKRWVDVDQYQIVGISYDTTKTSPDYNTIRYIYLGIKSAESKPVEVTKNYKYHFVSSYNGILNFASSPTEFSTRFPEFNFFYTDTPSYQITEEPTKFGDITRHFYLGKDFAHSIKVGDFGYVDNYEQLTEGKTWKTTYKGVWEWQAINSYYQQAGGGISTLIGMKDMVPLFSFLPAHVYQEIDSQNIDTADWSKYTYTSKRFYDAVVSDFVQSDTAGIYPENNAGIGYNYQYYTSHTKYSVQPPLPTSYQLYYSLNSVAPPVYHGSKYKSKMIIQNYIYEDGIKRIINTRQAGAIAEKDSTPTSIVPVTDYLYATQASLTQAKFKRDRSIVDDSFPGHSIKFKISPDYTFYNVNPQLRSYATMNGVNSYILEGLDKTVAVDITLLFTTTGIIEQSKIPWTDYPCGYSY